MTTHVLHRHSHSLNCHRLRRRATAGEIGSAIAQPLEAREQLVVQRGHRASTTRQPRSSLIPAAHRLEQRPRHRQQPRRRLPPHDCWLLQQGAEETGGKPCVRLGDEQ